MYDSSNLDTYESTCVTCSTPQITDLLIIQLFSALEISPAYALPRKMRLLRLLLELLLLPETLLLLEPEPLLLLEPELPRKMRRLPLPGHNQKS